MSDDTVLAARERDREEQERRHQEYEDDQYRWLNREIIEEREKT